MLELDTFEHDAARLFRDLEEIKGKQLTGGDSIGGVLTKLPGTWDVDTTVPGSAATTWWEVLFMPEDGRLGYTQLGVEYLVTPDSGFEYFSSYPSPLEPTGDGIPYIVEYSNPNVSPVNVKLKFSIRSFRPGSLSWSIVRQGP